MLQEYGKLLQVKDSSKVLVVSRKLRLGLHNGNTVLGGDWISYDLLEDKDDHDILLTATKGDLTVDGYVADTNMALAFIVEYELGTPAAKNHHFNSQAMMRSTTWQNGRLVTAFSVCAAIYIPYNGSRVLLRNTGPRGSPEDDGVDIELKLLKDEACSILSARPLLLAGAENEAAVAAESKGKVTLRASGKNTDDDYEDGPGASGKTMEEEDVGTALLGFDMRLFHPTQGEVMHNEDMGPIILLDQKRKHKGGDDLAASKKPAVREEEDDEGAKGAKDGSDDGLDLDATGRSRTFRGSNSFKARSFAATPHKSATATVRSELMRSNRYEQDDDTASVADSIVTGDSGRSSLRLDALYYTDVGRTRDPRASQQPVTWDALSELSERDQGRGATAPLLRDSTGRFVVPKDRGSLLAQSLQTRLVAKDHVGANLGVGAGELLPSSVAHHHQATLHQALDPAAVERRTAPKTMVGINSNVAHIRELSRGARSRLSRHGFDGAIIDTPLSAMLGNGPAMHPQYEHRDGKMLMSSGKNVVVDIDKEANDDLSLHEINIQFAGFRPGGPQPSGKGVAAMDMAHMNHYVPRSVYFSFQFYSCMPTRTEIMRLLPAEPGQLCVLARDEAFARDETPLTLRFLIDCSTASPNEGIEFAEYLAHQSLYVDVWDADSLLHMGTCGIPLRRLMRQGQLSSKQAVECDVINADVASGSAIAAGGISSTVVADGGPVSGTIVGAVQVILSNTGQRGCGPPPGSRQGGGFSSALASAAAGGAHGRHHGGGAGGRGSEDHDLEGLNWRAFGVGQEVHRSARQLTSSRPKNSVRAKPLSESSPELYKALADVRHSADHNRGGAGKASLRSLMDQRGGAGVCTLTYDEVAIIFRRFRGAAKGTVQYSGELLALMDLPSLSVALRKLIHAYKKFGDYDGLMKVSSNALNGLI
jgi:hypothetical protein